MMPVQAPARITVLIATYNRADLLARTLDTIALAELGHAWDVVVVDNNSTDHTRRVVERRAQLYPVPLRYIFEPRQGKSVALNAALAQIQSELIAFTDDDVRVPPRWLRELCEPLFKRADIAYTGGPVRPMWERAKPRWLDERGNLGGTIAVKDHGPAAFIFEEESRIPLGVNMCVRRAMLARIGGFNAELGRRGASLLGQEQAEFFYRARASGARGLYVPGADLEHFVPTARLNRWYFARWWFWKGVSHARLHLMHPINELGIDLTRTPRVLGVPRYMFGSVARHLKGWAASWVHGNASQRMSHAMAIAYVAGYCWDCRRTGVSPRRTPLPILGQPLHSRSELQRNR